MLNAQQSPVRSAFFAWLGANAGCGRPSLPAVAVG